jgi:hypothetical protein
MAANHPLPEIRTPDPEPRKVFVSVIIPARNAGADIGACLAALRAGERVPDEIIVVDDGSTDSTGNLAEAWDVTVLRVNGGRGAAYPRNVGVRASHGDLLVFIDSDVVVHPDTLARFVSRFEADTELAALMGSYDEKPSCSELLSQYRNLMHCYTHQHGGRRASTFWTGCGAVRRDVFEAVNGFDERYHAMEDIDLGRRIARAGHRVELDPAIRCKHRKRWTFLNMVFTDVFNRGIPWTMIILRDGCGMPNDLNLKWTQRFCVLGMGALTMLAAYAVAVNGGRFLTPLLGIALLVLGTYWATSCLQPRAAGARITVGALLAAYTALSWSVGELTGPPIVAATYLLLFLRHGLVRDNVRRARPLALVAGTAILAGIAHLILQMPSRYEIYMFFIVGIGLVLMNLRFYLFLCRHLGKLYGLASVPFHLLFHLYGGVAFVIGSWQYWTEKKLSGRTGTSTRIG